MVPSVNGAMQLTLVVRVVLLLFNPEHPEGFVARNLKKVKDGDVKPQKMTAEGKLLHESEPSASDFKESKWESCSRENHGSPIRWFR